MNLHYGDARNKNNSSGQNKLNKFTSNTYASSLINSTSSSPTLNSSLNSNTGTSLVVPQRATRTPNRKSYYACMRGLTPSPIPAESPEKIS